MIKVSGVSKRYGPTAALTDANLQIARGECVGLTGPNGSGRTTLLRVLATLIPPSAGLVTIDGIDAVRHVERVRSRLAYVGEGSVISEPLQSVRVREYLEFIRRARSPHKGRTAHVDMRDVLTRSGLADGTPLGALSAGMRVRLALAAALSCGADLLFLDEPLQLLDSESRARFLEWLLESRDAGMTLVVALNDPRDITPLCHRVAVFEAGRVTSPSRVEPHSARAAGLQIAGATSLA